MYSRYFKQAQCLTDLYISLMLLAFPLFAGFKGYSNITESKFLFFAILTAVWFVSVAVMFFLGREQLRFSLAQKIALAFALWVIISWIASPDKNEALFGASRYDGLVTQLLYVAVFLGVSRYGKWRRRYVHLLSAAVLVCAIVSAGQMLGSSVLFPGDYTFYDSGIRYVSKFLGTIGNTNLLAAFLSMGIPLAAAGAVFGYEQKPMLCIAAGCGAMLLSFTESAGGMVALIMAAAACAPALALSGVMPQAFRYAAVIFLGLFVGAFFAGGSVVEYVAPVGFVTCVLGAYAFENIIPKDRHYRLIIILLIAVFIFGLILVYFWPGEEGAVFELSQLLHGNASDDFGSSRIRIWRETLALVPESPIFGGGPDTLALRLELEFSRYFPELGQTLYTYADNSHNVYLGYLVNLGIPGLLIYLVLIAVTIKKIYSREPNRLIPGCALICALAENFFGLGLCLVSPIMWIIWGLVLADDKAQSKTGVEAHEITEETDNNILSAAGDPAGIVSDREEPFCPSAGDSDAHTNSGTDPGADTHSDSKADSCADANT